MDLLNKHNRNFRTVAKSISKWEMEPAAPHNESNLTIGITLVQW